MSDISSSSGGLGEHKHSGSNDGGVDISPDSLSLSKENQVLLFGPTGEFMSNYDISTYSDIGAAVNQAITDAKSQGGRIILPSGTYDQTTGIVIDRDTIHLQGAAKGATILLNKDSTINGLTIKGAHNFWVEDFRIQGSDDSANSDHGITFDSSGSTIANGNFRNVEVIKAGSDNWRLNEGSNSIFDINFYGCLSASSGNQGFNLIGVSQINFFGGWVEASGNHGVGLTDCGIIGLYGLTVGNAAGWALRMYGSNNININRVHLENTNSNNGLIVENGSYTGEIDGLTATKCQVDLADARRWTISGVDTSDTTGDFSVGSSSRDITIIGRIRVRSGTESYNSGAVNIRKPQDETFNGERGVSPSSGSYTASFDTAFRSKPVLDVTTESEAVTYVSSWSTDANGNYTEATIQFRDTSGSNVNPTFHWSAEV